MKTINTHTHTHTPTPTHSHTHTHTHSHTHTHTLTHTLTHTHTHRHSKPFNPLLGETYELVNKEGGYCLVAEQVSHHPPITAMHAESEKWVMWQEYRLNIKFRGQVGAIPHHTHTLATTKKPPHSTLSSDVLLCYLLRVCMNTSTVLLEPTI